MTDELIATLPTRRERYAEEVRRIDLALDALGYEPDAPVHLRAIEDVLSPLVSGDVVNMDDQRRLPKRMEVPRKRNPQVQEAIDAQTPVAIPPGTALYCKDGCRTAHVSGGFTDILALRTHTRRNHEVAQHPDGQYGRDPTADELTPRRYLAQ